MAFWQITGGTPSAEETAALTAVLSAVLAQRAAAQKAAHRAAAQQETACSGWYRPHLNAHSPPGMWRSR
jgi:hypothetical protein